MARLRFTPRSRQVIATWKEGATANDRDLIDEVLIALGERKSWELRWFSSDYPPDPKIKVIEPRIGLWVFVKFPFGAVDIVSISYGDGKPDDEDD